MRYFFYSIFIKLGLSDNWIITATNAALIVFIVLLCLITYAVAKHIIIGILKRIIKKSKAQWDDIILKHKILERLAQIIPAIVINSFATLFSETTQMWIERIAAAYVVLIFLLVVDKLLEIVNEIYNNTEVSKERPIKGLLQVVKILVFAVGIIIIIGVIIDKSPWVLLGSVGAASAVLLLVFQDSILGFVAGIQLSTNKMVQIGDWIEMSQCGADGEVIEISLHTVKVQNWDKTITTIPCHSLVAQSFKNWKGMTEAGGRRVKRSINIDMTSVRFCDEEMLQKLEKITYIQDYLKGKKDELQQYNKDKKVDDSTLVNGRHLTNIGTFRAYVEQYLKNHPKVHKELTLIVRQLEPSEKGIPIEIYLFLNDIAWANYEGIQSDLFDHIMAIIPEFGLRVFQSPTGHDVSSIRG